ncbi:trigger factor [Sphingosinicella sp. LY1275]|uniref:trigger factor n=1 Tax=Sphingosinicella sp. LY1275 TaxID=3095379 RepID=UPI002ADEC1E8|nr:trigger factor [Sphingosinicella sp. LY1275]MEA1013621.1 trigger factor [Sphingosinicella sp. LY1275]
MQTVETLNEGLKRAYKITIPAKDIDARVDGEIKKVAPQIRMPGFRPGKVPANLVRKMHGEALQQQALETAVQEGVQKLLADKKLRPAMQPAVALEAGHEPGKDAVVTVELETLPDVGTPKIDGLKLERLTVEADDAAVDAALERMVLGQKSFDPAPAKYAAKTGDLVIMDYVGKVDGEAFEGGTGEGMSVELGSGRLIPGFEDQLVGVKANEQRTLNVTFPEDYNVDYLKGKAATFDVTVTEVQQPREAKADDAFAKAMGLEGIDQLRGLLKGQTEQELNGLTRTHMKRKLLDQLAETHDFEVPPSMVEAEFNQIWAQLEHEASHEADPEAARKEMEAEREDYRKIAERRVRLGLLLSEIGSTNGVEVSNQEMNQLIMQAAQQYRPADRERFVQYVRQEPMAAAQLRAPLFEDKVVDFLFDKAEITDRTVTREELEHEIEAEEGHVHGPDCGHDHSHDAKPKAKKPAAKKADAKAEDKAEKAEAKPAAKKAAPKKAAKEEAPADAKPAKKPAAKKAPAKK